MSLSPVSGMSSPSRRCSTRTDASVGIALEVDVRFGLHHGRHDQRRRRRLVALACETSDGARVDAHLIAPRHPHRPRAVALGRRPRRSKMASSMPVGRSCTTTSTSGRRRRCSSTGPREPGLRHDDRPVDDAGIESRAGDRSSGCRPPEPAASAVANAGGSRAPRPARSAPARSYSRDSRCRSMMPNARKPSSGRGRRTSAGDIGKNCTGISSMSAFRRSSLESR